MEKDQCFACTICEFMTYSHINLEQHFRLRHDGMPPTSVFKQVFEPMGTIIAQMDALMEKSSTFASQMPVASWVDESVVASRVICESLEIMQACSKQGPDVKNGLSDEESKPCPVKLFKSLHADSFHIQPDPDPIKEEIPELTFVPTNVDHLESVSGYHEELELDIAGKPLFGVDTFTSGKTESETNEGNESPMEEGNDHVDMGSEAKQRGLTSESPDNNGPKMSTSPWICWVCFGKFARCVGSQRSLFLKHSKSFCPYAKNDREDAPIDQTQNRLFCPKDCNFVTTDASAFCKHMSMCVKPDTHTKSDHFLKLQSSCGFTPLPLTRPQVQRSRSLLANNQKAVRIEAFDDPQNYKLISAELSKLTSEAAKDLELLRGLPTFQFQECRRPPISKKPVGRMEKQNLTRLVEQSKKSVARVGKKGQQTSGQPLVGKKLIMNEQANPIHNGISAEASPLMIAECDGQMLVSRDRGKGPRSISRLPGRMLGTDKERGDSFLNPAKLQGPVKRQRGQGPFACFQCGSRFQRHDALQRHILCRHPGEKPFSCMHCGMGFRRNYNLHRHISRLHSNERPFQCPHCGMAFGSLHLLRYHMKTNHPQEYDILFFRQMEACVVEKSQSGHECVKSQKQNQYKCITCGKTFVHNQSLRRHVRINSCSRNGQRGGFPFSVNIQEHMGVEARGRWKHFACVHCDKSYPSKYSLKRHIRIKHTEDCPFSCWHCGKPFTSRHDLGRHLKAHAGNPSFQTKSRTLDTNPKRIAKHTGGKLHKCTTCGDCFNSSEILKLHSRNVHPKQKIFKCTLCQDSFWWSTNLRRHVLTKHKNKRPYPCPECGKRFLHPYLLRNHLKAHSREKSVPQKVCKKQTNARLANESDSRIQFDKACNSQNSAFNPNEELRQKHVTSERTTKNASNDDKGRVALMARSFQRRPIPEQKIEKNVHKTNVHKHLVGNANKGKASGIRRRKTNVSCKECGQIKSCESALIVHMRKHTGDRPYACQQCGGRFRYANNLKQHYTIVHSRQKPFKGTFCGDDFLTGQHLKKQVLTKQQSCAVCGKSFPSTHLLHQHMKVHTGRKSLKSKGRVKALGAIPANVQLKGSQKPSKEALASKPYICKMCGNRFRYPNNLRHHTNMVHSGESNSTTAFSGESQRGKKRIRPKTANRRPNHCTECGKAFAFYCLLRRHLQTHKGPRAVQSKANNKLINKKVANGYVATCGAMKPKKGVEKTKREMEKAKQHKCSVCEKMFSSPYLLRKHLNKHSKTFPYKCQTCRVSFMHLTAFKIHRKMHVGEIAAHTCPHCNKVFTHKCYLDRHLKTHKTSCA